MSWENILKYGYGLLHLTPEQLYEIDIRDFVDMVNGALMWHRDTENELYDTVMEQLSHFFANVMLSSGNYKKGTKLEKIRESLYIPLRDREKFERRIQGKGKRSHMPSDKKKVQELMKRFGKEVE